MAIQGWSRLCHALSSTEEVLNKAQKKDCVVAVAFQSPQLQQLMPSRLFRGLKVRRARESYCRDLGICGLASLLLLLHLQQQCAVDVWQDTSEGNRCADKRVEFFVAADGELEMAGGDALDFKVLGSVASEFEDFSSKVLEDGGQVDGGLCANARLLARDGTKMTLYATAREL